jgi:hypothetical protein
MKPEDREASQPPAAASKKYDGPWWEWVREHVEARLTERFDSHNEALNEALGEVIGTERCTQREQWQREDAILARWDRRQSFDVSVVPTSWQGRTETREPVSGVHLRVESFPWREDHHGNQVRHEEGAIPRQRIALRLPATDQWNVTNWPASALVLRCLILAGLSSRSVGDGSRLRNSSASSGDFVAVGPTHDSGDGAFSPYALIAAIPLTFLHDGFGLRSAIARRAT